ncbi:type IV toxin-antitoxin system AbiEi family antitoxin [Puia dinghuensis]|uniref:Transcriptional regulator AbiEi antitoxin N-terminal domain-containing protein n=1 Tax=Puia dinghuensis TaxID=1792502 RepID=A0A8J2XSL4_9BACT|nr:type IV toxin-antitoxin system AbiEi family antitoxin [Puia dinghuensis]GGA91851.1 hypothetical protein GCM10011511_14020 [Puia dinghuensis]
MNTEKGTKINNLLQEQPPGVVLQSFWLVQQGYSIELQKHYRKSNWLESIGTGAMIRAGEKVGYEGAIYALQKQSKYSVHPGGRTALSLLGKAQYLEFAVKRISIFGAKGEKLPTWFKKYDWGVTLDHYQTSFLPPDIGLTEFELKNFSIRVSGAIRALMECLYLSPEKQELVECFELMEGLNNLQPVQVQTMLERCQSVKVNRLFLYMAEKAGHSWFHYLDVKKVDLGRGKRSIVKNGVYVNKYQITVPRELEQHGSNI